MLFVTIEFPDGGLPNKGGDIIAFRLPSINKTTMAASEGERKQ